MYMRCQFWILGLGLLANSLSAAAPIRFAVIGDYGVDTAAELAVSQMVKTNFQPDFIITTGDNYYGTPDQIDTDIGKYYSDYIGHYLGAFGPGAITNKFYPALGNHDWQTNGYTTYLNYFTLPGNERYYDFVIGPVHFYMLNSDIHEPDGNTNGSVQAAWLSNRLAAATAPWKIVVLHHPPYSSTSSITPSSQWPFQKWGANLVLSGHAHNYERFSLTNFPYIVNGLGGAGLQAFGTPLPGSLVRYSTYYGAMLVTADSLQATFQFYSASGSQLIDTLTLVNIQPRLTITRVAPASLKLSWPTNAPGFVVESCPSLASGNLWSAVPGTPAIQGGQFVLVTQLQPSGALYRLRK